MKMLDVPTIVQNSRHPVVASDVVKDVHLHRTKSMLWNRWKLTYTLINGANVSFYFMTRQGAISFAKTVKKGSNAGESIKRLELRMDHK